MTSGPFDDLPVIGALAPADAIAKLREVGEEVPEEIAIEAATRKPETFGLADWWPFRDRAWQHTAHCFGFLPAGGGSDRRDILDIGEVVAEGSLKNQRVRITLNGLRVADYPGGGSHRVLLDFYARNQVPGVIEDLHFNATYRVREGERAAVRGYPVFVGLGVGSCALQFGETPPCA